MFSYIASNKRKGPIFLWWIYCVSQETGISELDKDEIPLSQSDSEEITVNQKKALADKEKV